MNRYSSSVTLLQASQDNPSLAKLIDIQRESSARLQAISPLIPESLRPAIKAGPFVDQVWCLLLTNSATVAKIRQLLPAFEAHLRVKGLEVKTIRLKVSRANFG